MELDFLLNFPIRFFKCTLLSDFCVHQFFSCQCLHCVFFLCHANRMQFYVVFLIIIITFHKLSSVSLLTGTSQFIHSHTRNHRAFQPVDIIFHLAKPLLAKAIINFTNIATLSPSPLLPLCCHIVTSINHQSFLYFQHLFLPLFRLKCFCF